MTKTENQTNRAVFTTRLGAIATTVGSAVGLGNIWRFPYEAGTHGGGAFMLFYVVFIFLIGVPVLCSEFILGRSTRSNVFGALRKLAPAGKWHLVGYLGILSSLMILSFYSVIAGWTMEYCFQSAAGALDFASESEYHAHFDSFSLGNWRPVMWTVIFLLCNLLIVVRGVTKGIEKASNILTPLLFLMLLVFCVNSLMMPKAAEGLQFLFKPDFSKIDSGVILGALGQAFFTLSLGLGCMLTYGSYFNDRTRIGRSAMMTATLDTAVAILAGIIIFPAVFSFGMSPEAGPTLVFEVLPAIFHQLPGGVLWSAFFFFLLFLASLTSTISMSETNISFFVEECQMSRRKATFVSTSIVMFFGILCTLSFGCMSDVTIMGKTVFGLFDYATSNIFLPVGGFVFSIFVGWFLERRYLKTQMTNFGTVRFKPLPLLVFCLRYVCPVAILLVFLNSIGVI